MDWEKDLCNRLDRIVAQGDEASQLRLIDELIDEVEDLVITAYLRGVQAGIKKTKERQ